MYWFFVFLTFVFIVFFLVLKINLILIINQLPPNNLKLGFRVRLVLVWKWRIGCLAVIRDHIPIKFRSKNVIRFAQLIVVILNLHFPLAHVWNGSLIDRVHEVPLLLRLFGSHSLNLLLVNLVLIFHLRTTLIWQLRLSNCFVLIFLNIYSKFLRQLIFFFFITFVFINFRRCIQSSNITIGLFVPSNEVQVRVANPEHFARAFVIIEGCVRSLSIRWWLTQCSSTFHDLW